MKPVIRNSVVLAIIFLMVVLVRLFLVGSYRITGFTMGYTLKAGDYVLVNKIKTNPGIFHNRLLLYQSPLRRDVTKPPLFVGRCIGVPGDVIQIGAHGFRVNGRLLPDAPMMQPTFRIPIDIKIPLLHTLEALNIPFRALQEDSTGLILRMSQREKEFLIGNLSKVVSIEMIEDFTMEYEFVIPAKGKTIAMDDIALLVCHEAIRIETGHSAVIHEGKLVIQGEEKSSFTFNTDYFWILSENEIDGIDSRHLGLIPHDHIIGTIWYCLYSKHSDSRFKRIK